MSKRFSIIQYFGYNEKESCGYCKSDNPNFNSHGMWLFQLSVLSYQQLINRGWRRSGMYAYKPCMEQSCCPAYTIRCDAMQFQISKSQKRILKRMRQYLQTGKKPKAKNEESCDLKSVPSSSSQTITLPTEPVPSVSGIFTNNNNLTPISKLSTSSKSQSSQTDFKIDFEKELEKWKSKPTKAKSIRILRNINKIKKKTNCDEWQALEKIYLRKQKRQDKFLLQNTLEELLENPPTAKHKIKIKYVVPSDPSTVEICHKLYQRYQKHVHKDDDDSVKFKRFENFLIDNPFLKEKIVEKSIKETDDDLPTEYGAFFMQYWLDEKLIAVSVIDILPYCVSSVYFFYDPDYDFLSLGIYSALNEIALVRKMHSLSAEIRFHYMGFYIHHITKMNYKAAYTPSFLLCPEEFEFQPIERCLPMLDLHKYSRLADKSTLKETPNPDDVLILRKGELNKLANYRHKNLISHNVMMQIKEFSKLVGPEAIQSLLYLVT